MPLAFWNNVFTLLSAVSLPRQESDVASFYVKHAGERPAGPAGGHQALHPGPHTASPLSLAELSDKWKVTHLKVSLWAGGSLGTGPSWGAASGGRWGTWGEGSPPFPGPDSPWSLRGPPGARRSQAT